MSQSTGPRGTRTPGSFSPVVTGTNTPSQSYTTSRPALRRVDSSSSDESGPLTIGKPRSQQHNSNAHPYAPTPPRPLYANSQANSSTGSLTNFSRPTPSVQPRSDLPLRNAPSPLIGTPKTGPSISTVDFVRGHGRKHSQTQGSFEPYLPTAAASNLGNMAGLNSNLTASQIAAQAAMQHQTHTRQRSQTVPSQYQDSSLSTPSSRNPSRTGITGPPLLSLTEASGPRESNFGGQVYHNGLLAGGNQSAAQAAANVVFPKSPVLSPGASPDYDQLRMQQDKPVKTEKSKVKLFSRPGKIGISKDKDARNGALPSPSKMSTFAMQSLQSLQRGNFSTNSLTDSTSMSSAASMYSMANSSAATIRAVDSTSTEKEPKDSKHKHHFLSRQKHKISSKEDHNSQLSSAASNSRPTDSSAPSNIYNITLPPSPAPTTTSFAKSMSGLDLRHGGRALREKKKEEKSDALRESELSYQNNNEWPGPSSLGSGAGSYLASGGYASSVYGGETQQELGKYNNIGPDDAWPILKAKLMIIFEGEDLRLPVEDFNRLVTIHLQRCIQKRAPNLIVEDLRDLLATGFSSLDQTLRRTVDERLIPRLVEMWLFTFTAILPYMQAVFLPLDLEFSGNGPLMSPDAAREFWGALPSSANANISAGQALEVRRIVLVAYRDIVILPRYDNLKTVFSRLSLESISLAPPSSDQLSTSPDSFGRPSTAMSLDPAQASYGSQATTLLGGGSSGDGSGNRSRAISNVSHYSDSTSGLGINNLPPPPQRPFTPSSTHPLHRQREKTVEDSSKQITETVGRMLQCMSVLTSVGINGDGDESSQRKMEELTRGLKLNWLGRGRMGRDRRGLVGARVTGTMAGGRSGVTT